MTRYRANMGKLMVKIGKMYLEYPYLCTRYGDVCYYIVHVTLWHGLLMSSLWLYFDYSWHDFSLGHKDAFFTNSFQTMIIIDWYVGIGCGMGHNLFAS